MGDLVTAKKPAAVNGGRQMKKRPACIESPTVEGEPGQVAAEAEEAGPNEVGAQPLQVEAEAEEAGPNEIGAQPRQVEAEAGETGPNEVGAEPRDMRKLYGCGKCRKRVVQKNGCARCQTWAFRREKDYHFDDATSQSLPFRWVLPADHVDQV